MNKNVIIITRNCQNMSYFSFRFCPLHIYWTLYIRAFGDDPTFIFLTFPPTHYSHERENIQSRSTLNIYRLNRFISEPCLNFVEQINNNILQYLSLIIWLASRGVFDEICREYKKQQLFINSLSPIAAHRRLLFILIDSLHVVLFVYSFIFV